VAVSLAQKAKVEINVIVFMADLVLYSTEPNISSVPSEASPSGAANRPGAAHSGEMAFFLERADCAVVSVSCRDRYVAKPVDLLLNLGPWRYVMFNSFLVARRVR
jgi:hypothetical protein